VPSVPFVLKNKNRLSALDSGACCLIRSFSGEADVEALLGDDGRHMG